MIALLCLVLIGEEEKTEIRKHNGIKAAGKSVARKQIQILKSDCLLNWR